MENGIGEDVMLALFEYDRPYGRPRYRPVNATARLLTALTGQVTFPGNRFPEVMALGVAVAVTTERMRVLASQQDA